MSRVLSTIPNPTPPQAFIITNLHRHFGEWHELNEAQSLAIQQEYRRRREDGELTGNNITRNVRLIAASLGITFDDPRQAEGISSILSFENMGVAARRAEENRAEKQRVQLLPLDNLTDAALDADDDLSDGAPCDEVGYEGCDQ